MLILEANNIKKYYGDRLIIELKNINIYTGDKIGIVGRNGAGKTTLLNILMGEIKPDEGLVKRYCDIAYIKQFGDNGKNADAKVLKEFGVGGKQTQCNISGGERTRLNIAKAISEEAPMIFADEPTSNLDVKGVELLKNKLDSCSLLLLISHDRALMDKICNKIIEVEDGKVTFYEGNFSSYQLQKNRELDRKRFEYEAYIDNKKHLEAAITNRANKVKAVKKAPSRMGNSEARLHKRESTEIQKKINQAASSLKTRLEKLEAKEKPKELQQIKLDFSLTNPPQNKIVISSDALSFGYVETGSSQILSEAKFNILNGVKYAVLGENGAGKTTLLNQIYNRNEAVRIAPKANLGYFCQGFENLNREMTILQNVMQSSVQTETTARTILARLLFFGDDVYKKVDVLSGGELIKVSFAKLFVSDSNVLLLDEPTNYLDMPSIQALEDILSQYDGTVLFVSHDTRFVEHVADRLLILENQKITEFNGRYQQYVAAKNNTKAQNDPQKMLVQMRITEVLAKLAQQGPDNAALEEEYQRLLLTLKES